MSAVRTVTHPGTRADRAKAAAGALRAAAADLADPRLTPARGLSAARLRELTVWLHKRAGIVEAAAAETPAQERNLLAAVQLAAVEPLRPDLARAVAEAAHLVDVTLAGYGLGRLSTRPALLRELVGAFRELDESRRSA